MNRLIYALAAAICASPVALAQPLPTDPRLVTGELDNGLSYIILEHDNPPDRASVYLHISTGSMNETDEQRGIAHYLEHMAFNGSENFEPGSVVDFFESLGLTFGRHQNAFTSFDQTAYILDLPDNTTKTLDKGMLFFADVAGRLSLLESEIDDERQIIIEEKRARQGAMMRVQEYILENIAPGSRFGQRMPIGTEETLMSVVGDDFRSYYSKWYIPSNITLIVVADMDPTDVRKTITKHFSGGKKLPRPVDEDPAVEPTSTTTAIVAHDAELVRATVSIASLDKPSGAVTTYDRYREHLVEYLGTQAFNRRLQAMVAAGDTSFTSASASAADTFNAFKWIQLDARGEKEKWRQMLTELAAELQRARIHGFTEREIEDARTQMLAWAERAVEVEPTQGARRILGAYNMAVATGETIMSAKQELDVVKKLLPGISAADASERFTEVFDTSAVTFIAQLPAGVEIPTESELVALGTQALNVRPDAKTQEDRPDSLMAELPASGEVVEIDRHMDADVWSAWLSNNVRVHYRFMDYKKDEVAIGINLAGGEIMETAENRGVTQAAILAWRRPATSTLSSTNIRDLMTGDKVDISGGAGGDSLHMGIEGSPDDLETGLKLAHLLLTDPYLEPAAFEQWQRRQVQTIQARDLDPRTFFAEQMRRTLYPTAEARTQNFTVEQIESLTRAQAQLWLERTIATAPMEVSIVGDIDRDRAFELVSRYVGSLPRRERISEETLDKIRVVDRPVGPLLSDKSIPTQTDTAVVFVGFYGADRDQLADTRLLSMASRIISTRMLEEVREDEQLVYSPGVASYPDDTYPGFSLFFAFGFTDPAKADRLAEKFHEVLARFAKDGPTEEELEKAKGQIANDLDKQMQEPGFWQRKLASMNYRNLKLDDVISMPDAYQSFSTSDIQEAFSRYHTPESSATIIVRPEPIKDEG